MTIRLRTAPLAFRMRRPHRDALREFEARAGVLVGLEVEGRIAGLGEASPLPGYSDESLADAVGGLHALASTTLANARAAIAHQRFDDAVAALAHLVPSARAAVQTALLDEHAVSTGVPLSRLLGADGTERVPAVLVASERASAPDIVERMGRARAVKWKVGRDQPAELAEATFFRAMVGPSVELRFDANRALDPEQDGAFVAALAALGPCLVEEPFADVHASLALSGVQVALDESLRMAPELACLEGVSAIVLKPTTLGLLESLTLARRAIADGRRAIVSHTLEGPVGLAACIAVALALPEPSPGLDSSYLEGREVLAELANDGSLRPASVQGLAIDRPRVLKDVAWT